MTRLRSLPQQRKILQPTLAAAILLSFSFAVSAAEPTKNSPITEKEVNAAQQAWCDGLVKIGKLHKSGGDYKGFASKLIDAAYDYEDGKVFFKPTLAFGKNTFRNTKAGALSYFVGGNKDFPDDSGFALKPWAKARYDNNAAENGIQIHGEIAVTMGNVYMTDMDGKEIMVDKTFVFRRCKDGNLRLCVHKSSLPFAPSK